MHNEQDKLADTSYAFLGKIEQLEKTNAELEEIVQRLRGEIDTRILEEMEEEDKREIT